MPLRPSRTSEHSGGERQCSKVRLEPYSRTNREQDVRNDTGRKSKQRICVDALRIIVFGRQGPEVRILSPRPVSFAIIGPCNLARHCLDFRYATMVSPLPSWRVPPSRDGVPSPLAPGHTVLRHAVCFYFVF